MHSIGKFPLFAAMLLCVTTGCARNEAPANFVSWRKGLASSAQPNEAYLKRAKSLGYDMVINLAPPEYAEAIADEGAILAAQGVVYVNIPVRFGNPTPEDFRLFSTLLKSAENKSVLVHCQVNLRGSSFSYLYRVIAESEDENAMRNKLTSVWIPDATWKKFIEDILAAAGKKVELL